jgi:hypothetical protein
MAICCMPQYEHQRCITHVAIVPDSMLSGDQIMSRLLLLNRHKAIRDS